MELWMWLLIGAAIWLVGSCCFEAHAWYIKNCQKWRWARRQDGLISFTNRELAIMRRIWPITAALTVIIFGLLFLSKFVVMFVDAFREPDIHSYPDLDIITQKILINEDNLISLADEVGEPADNPLDRFDSMHDAAIWMSRVAELFRQSIWSLVTIDEDGLVYFEQVAAIVSQFTDIDLQALLVERDGIKRIEVMMMGSNPVMAVKVVSSTPIEIVEECET